MSNELLQKVSDTARLAEGMLAHSKPPTYGEALEWGVDALAAQFPEVDEAALREALHVGTMFGGMFYMQQIRAKQTAKGGAR